MAVLNTLKCSPDNLIHVVLANGDASQRKACTAGAKQSELALTAIDAIVNIYENQKIDEGQ